MIKEIEVEKKLRKYLVKNNWILKNTLRGKREHGWDIITKFHNKTRKALFIECKGDGNSKNNIQKIHNSFWVSIG